MTDLSKKVSRRVTLLLDHRVVARERDKITVTLHPDATIGFRAHKCRREYRLPLVAAYKIAIRHEAEEEWKVKEQQARLNGKRKPRKPRRGVMFLK